MELKSFDTILTQICDDFDELISPRKMARANTNIIYLAFKAISKGWEIINNVCVALNNKFNPASCSDEDLVSTGKLVGTKMRPGSVSGLRIRAYNGSSAPAILSAGTYFYQFMEDVNFSFTVEEETEINIGESVYFTALSSEIGAFRVTQQTGITITSVDATVPANVVFSCTDNLPLLGHSAETVLEFRQRINSDIERQNAINELKEELLALPYVYDCALIFNQEESSIAVGDFTVPPYYLLVILSTAKYTDEIAEIIASHTVYPTVNVEGESHVVKYYNSVFASGEYDVYINDFVKKNFEIQLDIVTDNAYNTTSNVKSAIEDALMTEFNSNIYRPEITAEDIFRIVDQLNLTGVKLLGVTFEFDESTAGYITFNRTELPNLTSVGGI